MNNLEFGLSSLNDRLKMEWNCDRDPVYILSTGALWDRPFEILGPALFIISHCSIVLIL